MLTDNTAILRVLLIVLVCQVCLHYVDLYDLRTITTKGDSAGACCERLAPPR